MLRRVRQVAVPVGRQITTVRCLAESSECGTGCEVWYLRLPCFVNGVNCKLSQSHVAVYVNCAVNVQAFAVLTTQLHGACAGNFLGKNGLLRTKFQALTLGVFHYNGALIPDNFQLDYW